MNGFFGINGGEMIMLLVIGLIVLGPQRLPKIARRAGEISREIRAIALDFRQGIEREVEAIEKPLRDVKDEVAGPLSKIRDDLKAAGEDFKSGMQWDGPRTEDGPQPEDAAEDLKRIEAGEDLLGPEGAVE